MFGNLWCASSFLSKFKYTSHKFCISDSRKALLKTATEHKLNYNLTKRKKNIFIFLKNFCTSQMPWIPHKSTFKKTHMISKCLFFFLINGLHKKLALLNLCVCVCACVFVCKNSREIESWTNSWYEAINWHFKVISMKYRWKQLIGSIFDTLLILLIDRTYCLTLPHRKISTILLWYAVVNWKSI